MEKVLHDSLTLIRYVLIYEACYRSVLCNSVLLITVCHKSRTLSRTREAHSLELSNEVDHAEFCSYVGHSCAARGVFVQISRLCLIEAVLN